jgi:ABC-type nitrate/sulfonate/bicarbonate transport system substrate-binding protein
MSLVRARLSRWSSCRVALVGVLVGVVCLVTAVAAPASSSRKAADTVRISLGAVGNVTLLPEVLPSLDGAYAAQNLDVQFQNIANQPPALVAGQVDLSFFGLTSVVALGAVAGSPPLKLIYQMGSANVSLFIAALNSVHSLGDCKRMGVGIASSSQYNWGAYFKNKFHYSYEIIPITNPAAQAAALASGQIDCAINGYGALQPIVAQGSAHWIVRSDQPSTLPKGTPLGLVGGGLIGRDDWLKSHRAVVVRLLKAVNASLKDLRSSPENLTSIMMKNPDYAALGTANLTDQIRSVQFSFSPYDGYVQRSVWGALQAWMIAGGATYIDPADPKWGYNNFVDMSYYDQAIGGTRTKKSDRAHNTLVKIAVWVYGDRTQWSRLYGYNKRFFAKHGVTKARAANYALAAGTSIKY